VLERALVVDLPRGLAHEEEADDDQDEVAPGERVAEDGEQRPREAHQPRDREEQPDPNAEREGQPDPTRDSLLARGQTAREDRDEHDVVDAEDDLEGGQRRERDQAVGGQQRVHRRRHTTAVRPYTDEPCAASCSLRSCSSSRPRSSCLCSPWRPLSSRPSFASRPPGRPRPAPRMSWPRCGGRRRATSTSPTRARTAIYRPAAWRAITAITSRFPPRRRARSHRTAASRRRIITPPATPPRCSIRSSRTAWPASCC